MAEEMSAEDRVAVMELIARYAKCIDSGDLDGYVANFTPDGVIEWDGGSAVGREAIREWVGRLMARGGIGATPAQVRHFVGLPYITGGSERCSASTYVIIFALVSAGAVAVPSVGSYADTIVKVDGRWLFEKRVMRADLGAFGRAD
jgi:hypothetical protein